MNAFMGEGVPTTVETLLEDLTVLVSMDSIYHLMGAHALVSVPPNDGWSDNY